MADLLRHAHQLQGNWVILSPVHWQATHNDAMLMAFGSELGLTDNQSKAWFKKYADFLSQENKSLHYYDPTTWLLEITNQPNLNAKPVHQLLHLSLMPELARLDSSLHWQKFITESQMFFASSPNPTLLNGLWPWGGGSLSAPQAINLCTDETFFELVQPLSSKVSLYSPSNSLQDCEILLLQEASLLSSTHVKELTTSSVHWYWNNCAYAQQQQSWFSRLWRQ